VLKLNYSLGEILVGVAMLASCHAPVGAKPGMLSISDASALVLQEGLALFPKIKQDGLDGGPLHGVQLLSPQEEQARLAEYAASLQVEGGDGLSFFARLRPQQISTSNFVEQLHLTYIEGHEPETFDVHRVTQGAQEWYFLAVKIRTRMSFGFPRWYILEFQAKSNGGVEFLCASHSPGTFQTEDSNGSSPAPKWPSVATNGLPFGSAKKILRALRKKFDDALAEDRIRLEDKNFEKNLMEIQAFSDELAHSLSDWRHLEGDEYLRNGFFFGICGGMSSTENFVLDIGTTDYFEEISFGLPFTLESKTQKLSVLPIKIPQGWADHEYLLEFLYTSPNELKFIAAIEINRWAISLKREADSKTAKAGAN
jgi:hypothetical protein